MTQIEKVLYTAKVHTTGGRDGASRSTDGPLDIKLSTPGTTGSGTNPEQLFAAGWSACFEGAMGLAARKMRITLPPDLAIDAEVDLCINNGDYFLQSQLNVSAPGLGREIAQALVDAAHQTVPVFETHARQHRRRDQPGLNRRTMAEAHPGTFENLNHDDLIAEAARHLGAFIAAMKSSFGFEQARISTEDWLEEFILSDILPSTVRHWQQITIAASTRPATRLIRKGTP